MWQILKKKINNSSREGVIDFLEKSGKCSVIKKHYQNLVVQSNFNKHLRAASNIINNNAPVCYLFYCDGKAKPPIITALQHHLKIAGIKLISCSKKEEILEHDQRVHFIYVISEENYYKPATLKLIEKYKHMPDCFTFLVTEDIATSDIAKELAKIKYINLSKKNNYYLTIFEILKRLSYSIDLDKILLQLQCDQRSITDQQWLLESYEDQKMKSKADNSEMLVVTSMHSKILVSILLSIVTFIIILGYNKMVLKKEGEDHLFSSEKNIQFAITSYIPEILTGYEEFIGREKELQQINDVLNKDNMVIITGCSGVGKSSLAVEYGKGHKKNKLIKYFHAASKMKIDQQYRELAQELKVNVDKQSSSLIMQLINNQLSAMQLKILFIFDNVNKYNDVKEYLVNLPNNVKAIVTTKQPMLIANKPHIALEEFSKEEAQQYLSNSLQNKYFNDPLVGDLIENIGTLPYDIKCAAAYLLDHPSLDKKTDIKNIANKIKNKLFLEFIINDEPVKKQAWEILQYAASLDPDFISVKIIKELFPKVIDLSSTALKKLELLSLISIVNDNNNQSGFRIHRKLQQNILNTAKYHEKHTISTQKITSDLLHVLDLLFPEALRNTNDQWKIARELHPHVTKILNAEIKDVSEKDKINLANLYYKLAKYHMIVNVNYPKALKYGKKSLDLWYNLCKDNQDILPKLGNVNNVLGVVYERLGNVQDGLKHSKEGLKIRQILYVGNHPEIADSLYTVGKAYKRLGETIRGINYLELALAMNKHLYPEKHYQIARSLGAIGTGYIDLGNFEKSLEYLKASLSILTALHPVTHDKIADLQTNIAYNYNKLGKYPEALVYAKSSVDLMQKHYPDGHPVTIYSLDDFGETLIRTNNVKQGLDILHQALNMTEKFGMNKHFTTAWVLYNLGWGYFKNKNHPKALEYGERALNLRKEIYSSVGNHPELAESLHNLADINLALGNKNKGLQLYQDAIEMYTALSLDHLPSVGEIKQKINELASI